MLSILEGYHHWAHKNSSGITLHMIFLLLSVILPVCGPYSLDLLWVSSHSSFSNLKAQTSLSHPIFQSAWLEDLALEGLIRSDNLLQTPTGFKLVIKNKLETCIEIYTNLCSANGSHHSPFLQNPDKTFSYLRVSHYLVTLFFYPLDALILVVVLQPWWK